MGTVAQSILKIRRLVNDKTAPYVFSEDLIARLFWRGEVALASETRCCVGHVHVSSVPSWDFAITYLWEERACGVDQDVRFLQESFFPFELEGIDAVNEGASLFTNGFEIAFCDDNLELEVPFFLPSNLLAIQQLLFDDRVLSLRSETQMMEEFSDPGTKVGGFVSAFSIRDMTDARIVTNVVPTETDFYFLAIYENIPSQETSVNDETNVYAPFAKYAEYKAASILLSAETEKRNAAKAAHYQVRFAMGVNLIGKIMKNLGALPTRVLGRVDSPTMRKAKRAYPRLPDHYPALRVR
jgi:hypothetical protein